MTIAWERPAGGWVDDLTWHRRMFSQSRFRWLGEDVTSTALQYTRGRLEFATLSDLARLDDQLVELREYVLRLQSAVADPLQTVRAELGPGWPEALEVLGLSPTRAVQILWSRGPALDNHDTRRVLRGIPWSNPLTETWELLQLVGMYDAAADVLEDAVCDLAGELLMSRSPLAVAARTHDRVPAQLKMRIDDNLEARGTAGDQRRTPRQRY